MTKYIASIIDPNPRKIKNYLTALYFHNQIVDIKDKKEQDYEKIALISYLKLFYEPVYAGLENKPSMLKSIIKVCKENDRKKLDTKEEYFIYLEFLSHIGKITDSELQDSSILSYDKDIEEKFSNEVYLMQGRHNNFSNFKDKFREAFEDEKDIKKYL